MKNYFDRNNCAKLTLRITKEDIEKAEAGPAIYPSPFDYALERLGLRVEYAYGGGWVTFFKGDENLGDYWDDPLDNLFKHYPKDPSRGKNGLTPRTLVFRDPYEPPYPDGSIDFSSKRQSD